VRAADGIFTLFDAPGASSIGTYPGSINPGGEITGYYSDVSGVHGFVRDKYATISSSTLQAWALSSPIQ
jgi:hypothetical protein